MALSLVQSGVVAGHDAIHDLACRACFGATKPLSRPQAHGVRIAASCCFKAQAAGSRC